MARADSARLVLALVVAGIAAASMAKDSAPTPVALLEPAEAAFAESGLDVPSGALVVVADRIGVAPRDEPPVGTLEAPSAGRASTRLVRDHWTISFDVEQREPRAGAFLVELTLDDEREIGALALRAATSAPARATLVFDVGAELPRSFAYALAVRWRDAPAPRVIEIESRSNGALAWVGVGGRAGETNPSFEARVGDTIEIRWTNADGIIHDLVVLDPAGAAVAGPTAARDDLGAEESLAWTPTAQGEHAYACRFHATMRGLLAVS